MMRTNLHATGKWITSDLKSLRAGDNRHVCAVKKAGEFHSFGVTATLEHSSFLNTTSEQSFLYMDE